MSSLITQISAVTDATRVKSGIKANDRWTSPANQWIFGEANRDGRLPAPGETMTDAMRNLAAENPAAAAVVDSSGTLSRAGLSRLADRIAQVLAGAGVGQGARIGWMMHNRTEVLAVGLAAQRLGAVTVPLSYRLTASELTRLLPVAGLAVVVGEATTAECLSAAGAEAIDVDSDGFAEAIAAAQDGQPRRSGGGERLGAGASLLFTSGTTGSPKAAMRTRGDARLGLAIADAFGFGPDTRYLAGGPLYHSGPGTCAFMVLARGGTVGLRPRFDAADWLAFASEHQMTASFLTPTQLAQLVEAVEAGQARPKSLTNIVISGEPFPAALKRRAVAALGPCLVECYGCTELGPMTSMPAGEMLRRPASCGRSFPGVELAAFDGERRLGPGQAGMLWVRTPLAFDGYLGSSAPASRAGGWSSVGDVGCVDADGYVYLIDRADNLIISGGVNVFPADVEAVLAGHPKITRCAVFGLPDERWGQVVSALVVLGEPATVGELRSWLRGRISDDKRPHRVFRVSGLPVTGTGKLSRAMLTAALAGAEELPAT
jgi:acyl-CoA synthetase (AMP-forming)/AMP-acid ligase II